MANPSAAWAAGHPWSAVYDFFVERESLARVAGLVAFGTDTGKLYEAIAAIGELPAGSSVLDTAGGGAPAGRGGGGGASRGGGGGGGGGCVGGRPTSRRTCSSAPGASL